MSSSPASTTPRPATTARASTTPRTGLPHLRRRRQPWRVVASTLDDFAAGFPAAERRQSDPVQLVHDVRSPRQADREVTALVASCLAFGRVGSVIAKARAALDPLGARPAEALLAWGEATPPWLAAWRHRWIAGDDLAWLLAGIGRVLDEHGTLGASFAACLEDDDGGDDLLVAMGRFARRLHEAADETKGPRRTHGSAYLLPVPDGRGAAKRLCLFLRWMVREGDGVDLGLWPGIDPARLTIPLDTHVARIARYVGLTERRTADWKMAREITTGLARIDPADPTRYDFALSHLGISGSCPSRRVRSLCTRCDLEPICRL